MQRRLRLIARLLSALALVAATSPVHHAQSGPPASNPNLPDRVAALEKHVLDLQSQNSTFRAQLAQLQAALTQEVSARTSADSGLLTQVNTVVPPVIKTLASHMLAVNGPINDLAGPHIIFEGANYHFRNGLGLTGNSNGLGNLIVGYNEKPSTGYWPSDPRIGSHNLVLGDWNMYKSYGGIVAGYANMASGKYSSVTGGYSNTASGDYASVSGGALNRATGLEASISGGKYGLAESFYATINRPAYDSGWQDIAKDQKITFTHNVGGDPNNYMVDLEYWNDRGGIHNVNYGGQALLVDGVNKVNGAYWYHLTDSVINVYRGNYDEDVQKVRVRIWLAVQYAPM